MDIREVTDDEAVDLLAAAMKAKLKAKAAQGRHGWNDPKYCSDAFLWDQLDMHVMRGPGQVVDIANFCAMLFARKVAPNLTQEMIR